jgi:hypothetical protein
MQERTGYALGELIEELLAVLPTEAVSVVRGRISLIQLLAALLLHIVK